MSKFFYKVSPIDLNSQFMILKVKFLFLFIFLYFNLSSQILYNQNDYIIENKNGKICFSGKQYCEFEMDSTINFSLLSKDNIVNDTIFLLYTSCGNNCSYYYFFNLNTKNVTSFFNVYAFDLKNNFIATCENNRVFTIYSLGGDFIYSYLLDIKVPYLDYYSSNIYFRDRNICIEWNENVDDAIEGSNTYKYQDISCFKF